MELFAVFGMVVFAYVLGIGSAECVWACIRRTGEHKRRVKQVEKENAELKRTISFLKMALETKGVKR
jgi:hypothetical protein